jgi:hypothetical protein
MDIVGGWATDFLPANLMLNTDTLSTQAVTVAAVAHTLSFYGTGTVTLTGTSTAGPLVGTGVSDLVSLTFTPTAGTLTLTVSGSVTSAQLAEGSSVLGYAVVGASRAGQVAVQGTALDTSALAADALFDFAVAYEPNGRIVTQDATVTEA